MSSFGKEIVTIQFGSFPNYVGAHYFNFQNAGFSFNPDFPTDVNHDVLFREGKSENGSFTYTPRLVSVDLEQSLCTLSKTGRNFVAPPSTAEVKKVTQAENVEVHQVDPQPSKNEYFEDVEKQSKAQENPNAMQVDLLLKTKYDLTQSIKSWSELLTVNLHPRSITAIPKQLSLGLDVAKCTFKTGDDIWKAQQFAEQFEDNLRFQLEDCDTIQGFHLLTECDNLYSGMSNGCLDYLRDEFGKKSILTVPIFSLYEEDEDVLESRRRKCSNMINTGFNLSKSNELSDLVSPFSTLSELWEVEKFQDFGTLQYFGTTYYQSSAVMAACLELISTPYRLKRLPETKMSNIAQLLSLPGRKLVGAGIVFPFPDRKIEYDILELLKRHSYHSLCPFVPLKDTLDTQSVTLRGFPHAQFPSSPALFVSSLNVRIPRTFPDIIPHEYDLSNSALYYGRLREVSALSGLCNTREMKIFTDKLVEKLRPINVSQIPAFISANLEKPEFVEMIESLEEISASYDISMFL